jgi:phosphoadenosine phosphosulfate reductase
MTATTVDRPHDHSHDHPHVAYTHDELRVIARVASADLQDTRAQDVIRWAAEAFRDRVLISQSMANTALAHLVHTVAPEIPLVFLDTGYHFAETLATRDDLVARTGLTVLTLTPAQSVAEQDAAHGPDLWARDPDRCCRLRKVQPMEELLTGYEMWISGLRIAAAPHREGTPIVSFDERRGVLKVHPLLHWSDEDLLRYTLENDVPVNPLMYQGYPSIGCAPCTHPVTDGDDPRAGRWKGLGKTECGLHS